MFAKQILLSSILAAAITGGCAGNHAAMRGSVVMKIDPVTAHVCLGNQEVAVSDRVRLYKNDCATRSDGRHVACKKVTIAEGTVTQLLDEHYSVVAFPAGTAFEEGYTVEKL